MTDQPAPTPDEPTQPVPAPDQQWGAPPPPPPPMSAYSASVPAYAGQPGAAGPIGKVRGTGVCILLFIVTLGIYGWFWYFNTHDEMKRHSGEGIGGGIALLLGILVSLVMWFITPLEVGKLYERRGQKPPVTAVTGLWALLLGWFFGVGLIVWFVKTNGALNDYWRSLGAS